MIVNNTIDLVENESNKKKRVVEKGRDRKLFRFIFAQ